MVKDQPEDTQEQAKTPEKEKLQPQGITSMRASDGKADGKSGDAQFAEAKNIDPNSKELLDSAFEKNEVKYYKGLGLKEADVNGRECLIRGDINTSIKDDHGRTNLERMRKGAPPHDANGEPIELHHVGQKNDGPLAELTFEQHRSEGVKSFLHRNDESEIERKEFDKIRKEHWIARSASF